jgi:hypothetical protein
MLWRGPADFIRGVLFAVCRRGAMDQGAPVRFTSSRLKPFAWVMLEAPHGETR